MSFSLRKEDLKMKLKDMREKIGITQMELAKGACLSRHLIQMIESGTFPLISNDKKLIIAALKRARRIKILEMESINFDALINE